MEKFALALVAPDASLTHPVMVYVAPGSKTLFSEIDGPPVPLALVEVKRL
jgi:hypothetical protein